jgi:hypothetical protein
MRGTFIIQVFLDKWVDVDYASSFEDSLILASVQADQIGENNVRILYEGVEI